MEGTSLHVSLMCVQVNVEEVSSVDAQKTLFDTPAWRFCFIGPASGLGFSTGGLVWLTVGWVIEKMDAHISHCNTLVIFTKQFSPVGVGLYLHDS